MAPVIRTSFAAFLSLRAEGEEDIVLRFVDCGSVVLKNTVYLPEVILIHSLFQYTVTNILHQSALKLETPIQTSINIYGTAKSGD